VTLSAIEVKQLEASPRLSKAFLPVLHSRWSPRSFSDREVAPADLPEFSRPRDGPLPPTTNSLGAFS